MSFIESVLYSFSVFGFAKWIAIAAWVGLGAGLVAGLSFYIATRKTIAKTRNRLLCAAAAFICAWLFVVFVTIVATLTLAVLLAAVAYFFSRVFP